jgi:hypothetical protein
MSGRGGGRHHDCLQGLREKMKTGKQVLEEEDDHLLARWRCDSSTCNYRFGGRREGVIVKTCPGLFIASHRGRGAGVVCRQTIGGRLVYRR